MKGLSGGRPTQLQLTSPSSAHTCSLAECDHSLDHHLHHGDSRPPSYLLCPTESCPLDGHHRCSPRSSIHSECMVMPMSMSGTDHSISSSTFPRMHYGSNSRDSGGNTSGSKECRDDGGPSSHGGSGKMNRIPANLLDQFEKQMPIHRNGFHTLQYQRTSTTTTTTEQRNESPGRIRHLVHSVQKLFTKSHSLEGSSKMNGTKGDSHRDGSNHHPHGHHKHSKRSKSKERKDSGKQRSGGWWSSDDNLDSDSTYRTQSVMSRHPVDHISHCYPDSMHGHLVRDLSLKTSKSNNDVKCSACESISMAPEGKFMKRSSWSTLTVSQAKEAYRKSSLNLEKPMTPTDLKPNIRSCHYLQVPQDEWAGYPGSGKDDEIPCRRMRSSSYVKAMGDEESGESDSSPKTSPQKSVRPDALVKAIIRPRELLDSQSSFRLDKINSDMRNYITNFAADLSQSYHLQANRDRHPNIALDPSANYNSPKFRSRNQSYMRAVSTLSQASCVSQMSQMSETEINGQFESVCESVFSEMESQAMEALDLPGCFRTRSHSYLRAIQAGYSQDDECIPPIVSNVTSTIRSTTDRNYVQEDSCLPNQTSIHEDVADAAPLTHDDLGCPIRRDRLYHQEALGATAKPMSGPPVSPSLFRSPRSSATERPSPKAIQASIKESATLAAAISMQWKEEVSAMRRELADLRRDLCKELRAFNSNFNTFTQHYNTWSPQGGSVVAGTSGGAGMGTGTGMGPKSGTEDRPVAGTGQPGTSTSERGSTGAREKRPVVPKISVGTQARSKVLVRQSTADAAVNCPEEKEERKVAKRGLPKQLSMDPSILASPQSMYVESAIPLSLDPILPGSIKAHQSMPLEPTDAPAVVKLESQLPPESECSSCAIQPLSDLASNDPVTPQTTTPPFLEKNVKTKTNQGNLPSGVNTSSNLDSHFKTEQTNPEETPILHQTEIHKMQLPFPVPLLTVSPPEDQEEECVSDSESTDPVTTKDTCQDSQDPKTVDAGSANKDCSDLTQSESKPCTSDTTVNQSQPPVCESSTLVLDPSTLSNPETDITCPSIIVSEYFDPEPPMSPNEIDTDQDLVENLPDYASDLPLETSASVCSSTLVETETNTETETQDTEWPPLPEPQDTPPIYHADLIHFDLVMLTSLDQDDLDSVFMDPEPEPFSFSIESSSNTDDLDPPLYHSPLYHSDSQSSPLPTVDPALMSPLTPSPDLVCLDPAMEYRLAHMAHGGASELHEAQLPQVTVTISPPSVSPDTSFEISTGSAPDSPIPDTDPLSPDLQDPSQQAPVEQEDIVVKTLECATITQATVETQGNQEGSSNEDAFLWCRWQRRGHRQDSMHRSASVELWSGRYEYNSAEITYVSLTL